MLSDRSYHREEKGRPGKYGGPWVNLKHFRTEALGWAGGRWLSTWVGLGTTGGRKTAGSLWNAKLKDKGRGKWNQRDRRKPTARPANLTGICDDFILTRLKRDLSGKQKSFLCEEWAFERLHWRGRTGGWRPGRRLQRETGSRGAGLGPGLGNEEGRGEEEVSLWTVEGLTSYTS